MNRRELIAGFTLLALSLFGTAAIAADTTYHFGVSEQRTNITFQSETDFETILGSSRSLSGSATVDLSAGTIQAELSVPIESMRTGIDLRDKHMKSGMWLDAKKFPNLTFKTGTARKISDAQWEVAGTFTMHGVSKEISTTVDIREIPAELSKKAGLEKGDWVKIVAPFSLNLSDFGVVIPKKAAAKVNDTWEVRIQAFASTVGG